MASILSPETWTLRFKNNRSTILLYIDPLQSLSSVKSELMRALKQTQPNGKLNGLEIPQKSSDIRLARPVDVNDLSAGWESIEPDKGIDPDVEESGKGKGKASPSLATGTVRGKVSKNALQECAQSVGLRDGGIVAFKFGTEQDEVAQEVEDDEEENEDEDGSVRIRDQVTEKWDVVVPTWDDGYDDIMDQDER